MYLNVIMASSGLLHVPFSDGSPLLFAEPVVDISPVRVARV